MHVLIEVVFCQQAGLNRFGGTNRLPDAEFIAVSRQTERINNEIVNGRFKRFH
jgi:hypothetical protein